MGSVLYRLFCFILLIRPISPVGLFAFVEHHGGGDAGGADGQQGDPQAEVGLIAGLDAVERGGSAPGLEVAGGGVAVVDADGDGVSAVAVVVLAQPGDELRLERDPNAPVGRAAAEVIGVGEEMAVDPNLAVVVVNAVVHEEVKAVDAVPHGVVAADEGGRVVDVNGVELGGGGGGGAGGIEVGADDIRAVVVAGHGCDAVAVVGQADAADGGVGIGREGEFESAADGRFALGGVNRVGGCEGDDALLGINGVDGGAGGAVAGDVQGEVNCGVFRDGDGHSAEFNAEGTQHALDCSGLRTRCERIVGE